VSTEERPHTSRPSQPGRAILFAAASIVVGLGSSTPKGREVDAAAFHAINGRHSPAGDRFFGGVTELGALVASVAAAAVLALRGRPRVALRGLGAAGIAWLAGQGLKKVFGRPRPWDAHPATARLVIGGPGSTSWPSSHPAVLLAFLTVVGRDLDLTEPARAALLGVAATVGVSRTYLGVHFPSDVIGGLLLGHAVGIAWPATPGSVIGGD
jgi:undecaprenyl-diphosphatase